MWPTRTDANTCGGMPASRHAKPTQKAYPGFPCELHHGVNRLCYRKAAGVRAPLVGWASHRRIQSAASTRLLTSTSRRAEHTRQLPVRTVDCIGQCQAHGQASNVAATKAESVVRTSDDRRSRSLAFGCLSYWQAAQTCAQSRGTHVRGRCIVCGVSTRAWLRKSRCC